ncbi:MAG: MtrB/PioB family decaheme-associated outer membrane protein, partial [Pseudomonadota bacterium]
NDGFRTFGGSLFTTASLLPMPFDYVTDEVDVNVRYSLGAGYLALGWYLSDFDNQNTAINWESPFTTIPGSETLSAAQAPDNQFQQLKLGGGYRFAALNTSVNASVAMGEIEQTTPFLPYTTNDGIATAPLPRTSLDGSVDTLNYALALTSRPFAKARVRLSYRYDERDNTTPVEMYERVIVDTILSGDPEANLPYSYERSTLQLSGDYDLFDSVRISGGYERRDLERDLQEVREQTEDTGWGRVRWRPNDIIEIDGRAGTSRRDIDSYNEVVAVAFGQNPLLRKYNMAFRFREFAEVALSIMPPGSPLSVTLDGRFADDDYSRSQVGLVAGKETYLGADIGYAVSDVASFYVNVSTENIESEQFGSETFGDPDWRAFNDDDYSTVGLGFRIRQIADRIDLQIDYTRADGTSSIQLDSASNSADLFPDLETTLDFVRLRLGYRHSEKLDINASATYQSFRAEDWSIQGVGPATIPEVLSLGPLPYDDEQILLGIGFQYRLGQDTL